MHGCGTGHLPTRLPLMRSFASFSLFRMTERGQQWRQREIPRGMSGIGFAGVLRRWIFVLVVLVVFVLTTTAPIMARLGGLKYFQLLSYG
jgi:hypothetical protein